MSTSFFNTCIEVGIIKLDQRIYKIYTTGKGSYRHQRINELLIVCYKAFIKYYPDFKISEKEFTDAMNSHIVETINLSTKRYFSKLIKDSFSGLPEKMYLLISEPKFSEMEKIPEKIPNEIDDKDLVNYMLNAMSLIMEQKWDYEFSKDKILLKHFLNQDMLFEIDSKDEHDFVKKTIENRTLPSGSTEPNKLILLEANLADLRLTSEIIYKFKQPALLSGSVNSSDEIYQLFSSLYHL